MREDKRPLTDFILGLIVLGLLLGSLRCIIGCAIRAAPAPAPRPVVVRTVERLQWGDLAGQWMMEWGGSTWDTKLRPDGTYACILGETLWVGHWRIDFQGRLEVSEALVDENGIPGTYSTWAVAWEYTRGRLRPDKLTGRVTWPDREDTLNFALKRSVKPKR